MYKIIGGDQKEYGPVTAADIRQWIAEHRLNAQSKVLAEGSADWKPLSEFPEFADALRAGPQPAPTPAPFATSPGPGSSGGGRAAALQQVSTPALWLLVVGIIDLTLTGFDLVSRLFLTNTADVMRQLQMLPQEMRSIMEKLMGPAGIALDLAGLVVDVLIILGATRMKVLQSHGLAVAASVLAVLPCLSPCCILSMPFGIWALVVLLRPEVKSQFS